MTPVKPRWSHWLAVGLLLLLFAQLATSAAVKSPTFDEPLHTARAYYVMRTGQWDMQAGHLPLLYRLLGPLFWALPELPPVHGLTRSSDHVQMARQIIHALNQPWDTLIVPLRVFVMGLTLLLGASLYRWAGERHGASGSLLALFVYVLSPNIMAHGRLVTTDLVLACFFFLAVYAFDRLLDRPTIGGCSVAGLALGLALASKASALLLIPVFCLLVLARSVGLNSGPSESSRDDEPWLRRLLSYSGWLAVTTFIAGVVLWVLYGVDAGPWIEGWPALPLATYVRTLRRVGEHGGPRGHPAFFMGQRSGHGWSAYFPIALGIKTPLPTLIGALAGTVWLLLRRRWWTWLTAFLPSVLFLAAAMFSSLNIGYRHILPVVPFLILLLSSLTELPRRSLLTVAAGGGLALWLLVGTFRVYPDYLAYFNGLVGGPPGGHRYLTDSNLDWGQDLIQLRDYVEDHNIEQLSLSYFGNVDPAAYGIRYNPLPSHFSIGEVEDFTPFAPRPGFYAVSVTNLSGQYLIENPSVLNWFTQQEPLATIGHSINIYHVVPNPSPPTWVGICQAPGAPLDGDAFAERVGRDDLRSVRFDCRNSWVFVDGGAPGWYVVPATDETDGVTPPAGPWLTVYEQENYDGKLLFSVYRWQAQEDLQRNLNTVQVTPSLPARVGNLLELLGYELNWVDDHPSPPSLRLLTYWRVLAQPERPLSLMAHLVDEDGRVVAAGDALGVPIEGWASGDIVVQEHQLTPDSITVFEGCRVELGAYWLPSLESLPILDSAGAPLVDDVIRLLEIEPEAAR